MLYHAWIKSHLVYGILSWGGTFQATLRPLEYVQRHIVRCILGKKRRDSLGSAFKDLGLLEFKRLYAFQVLKYIKKNWGNQDYRFFPRDTRMAKGMFLNNICAYKAIVKRHYNYLGSRILNLLPDNLKLIVNRESFTKEMKKWILNCGFFVRLNRKIGRAHV